jgi:hypothetical protein
VTSLSVSPTYPIPGRPCELTFVLTESGANFARIWVTDAPLGSDLRAKLTASGTSRLPFHTGDVGEKHPVQFRPDKGGVYTFVVQEYVKGTSYGGGYQDDPNAAPSETKVGAEATLTLQVGQRVTQRVGVKGDTATLALWIFGSTIRPTTIEVHGEVTPALMSPTSPRAVIAVETTAVKTELANLANASVATALGTLATIVANMVGEINDHLALTSGSVHNAADSDNTLPVGLSTTVSPKDLPATVNAILKALRQHYTNDDNTGAGPDSAAYHKISSVNRNDRVNLPLFDSAGDLEQAYAALADIWRSYEAHRVLTSVHGAADNTNALAALPTCLKLHKEFLAVLASSSPSSPATVNSGVVTAVSVAGFREA